VCAVPPIRTALEDSKPPTLVRVNRERGNGLFPTVFASENLADRGSKNT